MEAAQKIALTSKDDYLAFDDQWVHYKEQQWPINQLALYPSSTGHRTSLLGREYILRDLRGDVISTIHISSYNYHEVRSLLEMIRQSHES
ncbi:hypothetical protein [Alicyclobacillus suci]|uniref:hypothetical protein n=1 Tax=Alicyclobacillus suci TaxID=2816080 RepID=UPI001A8CFD38|nr:hypothetical protein [Alicyclobacillus suci]